MGGDLVQFIVVAALATGGVLALRSYVERGKRSATGRLQRDGQQPERWPGPDLPAHLTTRPVDGGLPAGVPPAPPAAAAHPALEESRAQAVLLRRDFPPRSGAASHWGGIPSVPPGFTWPFFFTDDGRERALHHVLQLDCATVPEAGRLGLLPDHGMLYVFLDLDWGRHWRWSVRYVEAGPDALVPADVPVSLPHAYDAPGTWGWPRSVDDWPRLLPEWSIDPVVVTASGRPVDSEAVDGEDSRFWPGTIPLAARVEAIDGAVAPAHHFRNTYDAEGGLERPYATYPHDWRAVAILMGHLARQAERQHLDDLVRREVLTRADADAQIDRLRTGVGTWSQRAALEAPWRPVPDEERDAVWSFVLEHQAVALFGLTEAVNDALDATLSGNPDAARTMPREAVGLVRSRHALALREASGGLAVVDTARMLCAPSYVQGDAEERLDEWLLLLEMSGTHAIGHHFGEGVYQLWIRPADLAARRFDLVELTASAY